MPRFAVASSPLTLILTSLVTLSACGDPAAEDMMAVGSTPTDGMTPPTPTPTPTPSPTPAMPGTGPMPTTTATPMPTDTAMPMPTDTAPMPTDTAPVPSGDAPPVRGTSGPSYATTVGPIFEMQCTVGCHEQGGALGGPGGFDPNVKMDLSAAAGYATLTAGKSAQATDMWIVGETVEDSYLWHKLNDTHLTVGGSGAKMPITGEITEADLTVIQAWIEGGATP